MLRYSVRRSKVLPMMALIQLIAMFCLVVPLQAYEIRAIGRHEDFSHRDTSHKPIPKYRDGYVFSINQSRNGIWIDHVVSGPQIERVLSLPDSFRFLISGIAVSFDGRIAVSGRATDRMGRISSLIVWLELDGSIIRIVRTSPFSVRDIEFTADGSLWAIGMEVESQMEKSVHDVVRQYDSGGRLVRSLLPRLSLSTGKPHPTEEALIVTSRNYMALISMSAKTWKLVSVEGLIVDEGFLNLPEGINIFRGAVTDSGRLFIEGYWSSNRSYSNKYPRIPLFEIDRNGDNLQVVRTHSVYSEESLGTLLGSEGEQLIFHVISSSHDPRVVWTEPE